jgi:hypothetical protein
VVAKNDPYMLNLIQNKFEFLFELILHLFYLLYVMLALITKKGEIEREMCQMVDKVQIKYKGMFLRLSTLF